jgi:hypothetical protein
LTLDARFGSGSAYDSRCKRRRPDPLAKVVRVSGAIEQMRVTVERDRRRA